MKIRRVTGKRSAWQLDCGMMVVDGVRKRVQLYFRRKEDAEEEMARRAGVLRESGTAGLALSEAERARWAAAKRALEAAGTTIEEAVRFWIEHHGRLRATVTVQQMIDLALEAKAETASDGYLIALRCVWRSFGRRFGAVPASEIRREDVESWLAGSDGWSVKTRRNYLADLSALFEWARHPSRGLAAMNPCRGVEVHGRVTAEEISCMTPAQARQLIEVAAAKFPELLGYVALGLFAGIRAKELEQLEAGDIVLPSALAVVSAHKAKTRARRTTELSDNALAWLREWRRRCPEQAGVWPKGGEARWGSLRAVAGWSLPWPRNVMRHTFASMHYAAHADEARLKAALGHHASEDTLMRHYRAVRMLDGETITPTVAAEFWAIAP